MDIAAIVGLGVVAAVLAVLLRQTHPEYAMLVSLAAGVLILAAVLDYAVPVVEQIRSMLAQAALPGAYGEVLFKAMGICFLTQVACDACRDAGESAIGARVELAGKVAVLLISLPLFEQVLRIARELIG